jgi:hypothetical protein
MYIDVNDDIIKEANELYLEVILLDLNENDKEYIESMNIFINTNTRYRAKLINNYLDLLHKLIE